MILYELYQILLIFMKKSSIVVNYDFNKFYENLDTSLKKGNYKEFNSVFGAMCINKKYTQMIEFQAVIDKLLCDHSIILDKTWYSASVTFHKEFIRGKISYEQLREKIFCHSVKNGSSSMVYLIGHDDILSIHKSGRNKCLIFVYQLCFLTCQKKKFGLIKKLYDEMRTFVSICDGTNKSDYMLIIYKCKRISKKFSREEIKKFFDEIVAKAISLKSTKLLNFFIKNKHIDYAPEEIITKILHRSNKFLKKVLLTENNIFTRRKYRISYENIHESIYKTLSESNILENLIFDRNMLDHIVKRICCPTTDDFDIFLHLLNFSIKSGNYLPPSQTRVCRFSCFAPMIYKMTTVATLKQIMIFWRGTNRCLVFDIYVNILSFYLLTYK